jgi:hypothetical protein
MLTIGRIKVYDIPGRIVRRQDERYLSQCEGLRATEKNFEEVHGCANAFCEGSMSRLKRLIEPAAALFIKVLGFSLHSWNEAPGTRRKPIIFRVSIVLFTLVLVHSRLQRHTQLPSATQGCDRHSTRAA